MTNYREGTGWLIDIKRRIKWMLDERQETQKQSVNDSISPSEYWLSYCTQFRYLFDLDWEYLSKIRSHTYHLTGDIYTRYLPPQNVDELSEKMEFLWGRIPPQYRISEPESGYGFEYGDRWINTDFARFQVMVNILFDQDILSNLSVKIPPLQILEIGGGYGGMGYSIMKCLQNSGASGAQYFIVDLPEVLLFSSIYLATHTGVDEIYVYNQDDIHDKIDNNFSDYKFVLLPNYKLDLLEKYRYSLVINMASFQEMKESQVRTYLEFVEKCCSDCLVSLNRSENKKANAEGCNLDQLLEQYFQVKKVDLSVYGQEWVTKKKGVKSFITEATRKISGHPSRLIQQSDYQLSLCRPPNR